MIKLFTSVRLAVITTALSAFSLQAASIVLAADGNFANGALLSGTVTIDTDTGLATAVNLVVGAPSPFVFDILDAQGSPIPNGYQIQAGLATPLPDLSLLLPFTNLIGYSGGSLCAADNLCGGFASGIFDGGSGIILQTGTLSSSGVPEPSTVAMLSGALALVAVRRRRRINRL